MFLFLFFLFVCLFQVRDVWLGVNRHEFTNRDGDVDLIKMVLMVMVMTLMITKILNR